MGNYFKSRSSLLFIVGNKLYCVIFLSKSLLLIEEEEVRWIYDSSTYFNFSNSNEIEQKCRLFVFLLLDSHSLFNYRSLCHICPCLTYSQMYFESFLCISTDIDINKIFIEIWWLFAQNFINLIVYRRVDHCACSFISHTQSKSLFIVDFLYHITHKILQ